MSIVKIIGEDIIGLVPSRIRFLCEKFKVDPPCVSVIDSKKRGYFTNIVVDYFDSLNSNEFAKNQSQILQLQNLVRKISCFAKSKL